MAKSHALLLVLAPGAREPGLMTATATASLLLLLGMGADVVGLEVAWILRLKREWGGGRLDVDGLMVVVVRGGGAVGIGLSDAGEVLGWDAEADALGSAGGLAVAAIGGGGGGGGSGGADLLLHGLELLRGVRETLVEAVDLFGERLVGLGEVLDVVGEGAFDGVAELGDGLGHVFHFAAYTAEVVLDAVEVLTEVAVVGFAFLGVFAELVKPVGAEVLAGRAD